MAKYRFESVDHLFFFCRKMLINNGVDFPPINDSIKYLSGEAFDLTNVYGSAIYNLQLREPTNVLTFLLKECSMDDIVQTIDLLIDIMSVYQELIIYNKADNEKVERLLKERFSLPHYSADLQAIEKFGDLPVSEKLIEIQNQLRRKHGIYFLYNNKKKLIYVGKSSDLASRIPTSIRERKAYYFSYAITKTSSDSGIYEMYYIAKLKPKLNIEGKYPDELTVTLPELERSEINPVFNKKKKSVATNNGH